MLDVINGLANGWVVTPVIDALARRRLFEALAQQPMRVDTLVQRYRANEGYLRAALLLLYELGWLDTVDTPISMRPIGIPAWSCDCPRISGTWWVFDCARSTKRAGGGGVVRLAG